MSYHAPKTELPSNPITWAQIKYWLKLDDDDERADLLELASDQIQWAEDIMSATLVRRTRTVIHYEGAGACGLTLEVPYGPVANITSVVDANGDAVPYKIERAGIATYVKPIGGVNAWPVTITYVAGEAALPGTIRRAILIAVETLHRNRGGEADLSAVERMLRTRSQATGAA